MASFFSARCDPGNARRTHASRIPPDQGGGGAVPNPRAKKRAAREMPSADAGAHAGNVGRAERVTDPTPLAGAHR